MTKGVCMSSRDNMNRFAIVAGCLLLANALGCMSDYHTSGEDCEKLREMMGSWHSQCECATENQFDDLESAVDLLISKLNAFCQAHKVGRAALLSAIDMKPLLSPNNRDVVYVLGSHGGERVGVLFMFNGGCCVRKVLQSHAIE